MPDGRAGGDDDGYLTGRGQAWFAFAMTFGLMLFDYIDRQMIVYLNRTSSLELAICRLSVVRQRKRRSSSRQR